MAGQVGVLNYAVVPWAKTCSVSLSEHLPIKAKSLLKPIRGDSYADDFAIWTRSGTAHCGRKFRTFNTTCAPRTTLRTRALFCASSAQKFTQAMYILS